MRAEHDRERAVDLAQLVRIEPSGRVTETVGHDRGSVVTILRAPLSPETPTSSSFVESPLPNSNRRPRPYRGASCVENRPICSEFVLPVSRNILRILRAFARGVFLWCSSKLLPLSRFTSSRFDRSE